MNVPPHKITVVTNGNYFAALGLGPLLSAARERFDVQVLVTTGLRRQSGNRLAEAWLLARRWGWRYFIYKSVTYILPAAGGAVRREPADVAALCDRVGVPVATVRNVNDAGSVTAVREFGPDLLVSFSCPYRIMTPLLQVARIGNLNVHSSLLPSYAGVCTYVHVLAEGCDETGVTVHEMVEQFDAGRILEQGSVSIPPRTSTFSLFSGQCRLAGTLLLRAIDTSLAAGRLGGVPQDMSKRSYRGEPTAADINHLRRRGHRLMTLADAVALFRGPATSPQPRG